MGLKVIYGRAGTGKSYYCFEEIANRIDKNEKIYIITPEQFSFTAEQKLLEAVKREAVINAEILTFNRMAYRVMNEIGGTIKTNLSASGKAMLIYNILLENKAELKFLGKTDENIELVATAITEFKKHNVTVESLGKVIEETEDAYLKLKLKDLYILYKSFEQKISENYIDENDALTILGQNVDKIDMFKDALIYIDEFVGFTKQEYLIIEKLVRLAKEVNVTICTDELEITKQPDADVFYENKVTYNKILELVQKQNIKVEKNVKLDLQPRYKSEELEYIEKFFYDIKVAPYSSVTNDVGLFLANNRYSEIENVAKKILKLVRDEGYRYKEISVITKDIEVYSNLIKAIFNKYNISVFIDEKKDLSQNILVKYILALLDVFAKNWSAEAVFNYVKTGFCDIEKDDYFVLENYCLKWGIKGNKWHKEDWKFGNDESEFSYINDLRKKIVQPLVQLKEKVEQSKDVKNITTLLYKFLIENKIDVKLKEKIRKLEGLGKADIAKEYETSWNVLISLFDEIVLIFEDKKITFEKYRDLLKIGLKNSELGKIPLLADSVCVGDVDRSRSHKTKVIFVIGLNDGHFPSTNKNEGFLNDVDRGFLKTHGVELAKGTEELLYDDNFNIYKVLTTAEEKLFLSYPSSDNESKPMRPSVIITKMKKIFSKLIEKSDIISNEESITTKQSTFEELLINLRNYGDEKEISSIWFDIYKSFNNDVEWKEKLSNALKGMKYSNVPEKISEENLKKMYGDTLKTSVSKLEQYKNCPFSFFLKYGLQISEKEKFKIEALDTGSFMHDVIDKFFDIVRTRGLVLQNLGDEDIKDIIDEILKEKLKLNSSYIFSSTEKYKVLTIRLKGLILKSMKYIIESIIVSEFEVWGNEVEFSNTKVESKNYPPIVLEMEDNKRIEITGKIDRVDVGKLGDNKYVRVIDYKSSVKNLDLNKVVAGLQIQLLTYLDAMVDFEKFNPAGVLYFNLIDPIIKADKNMSEEEIEQEIRKNFSMKGLILADVNVIKMMDKNLITGKSKIVPAYLDSKENITEKWSSTVTKEQFEDLQKFIKKVIKDISKEIFSGNIDLKPYNKQGETPCKFCKYKAICQFNNKSCKNSYNYIQNANKEVILEKIKNL